MSLFCRHEWDYIKSHLDCKEKTLETTKDGEHAMITIKCGFCVYCTRCGKISHRLSRKLGKIYVTHAMRSGLIENYAEKSKEYLPNVNMVQVDVDVIKVEK